MSMLYLINTDEYTQREIKMKIKYAIESTVTRMQVVFTCSYIVLAKEMFTRLIYIMKEIN